LKLEILVEVDSEKSTSRVESQHRPTCRKLILKLKPKVNIEVEVYFGVESQQLEWKVFVRCKEESIASGGRS
jgi:hypothetical protein